MNLIFNIEVKGSDKLKFLNNQKEGKNGKNEGKVKKTLKKQVTAALVAVGIKLIPLILIITIITSVINWVIKIFQPKNTVNQIYKKLEIEDVHDLIQIKGNDNDGYYLDFADGIDDKLDETIEYLDSTAGVKSGINKDFLKKTIKAEVCTQFPNLGGKVPENTSGFQGVVDILRITPNKDINSLKNTGVGKETIKNNDESNNVKITNEDEIKKQEEIIKGWKKGQELTLSATAYVYSQEDSKLHKGEKIDYWTPQKDSKTQEDLEISKGQTVTYTGKYSRSIDKMTNEGLIYVEIKKDEIKGYIKYNFIENSSGNNETTDEQIENVGYEEVEEEKVVDTIDSNVYKMTYLPKETFDNYVKNANKEALHHFTIDDDGNLITATWSYNENGLEITNNSSINLKTALQNYILPSAYLLYFYMEADYESFSSDLADVALNSKIILALEDNVTTTKVDETTEEKKVSESSKYSEDWHSNGSKTIQTEYCSTNTEIIYADIWCVKLVNKDIYRDELLNVSAGKSINLHMPGTVTEDKQHNISPETESGSGTDSEDVTETKEKKTYTGLGPYGQPEYKIETVTETNTYNYAYKLYQRTVTDTHSISNSYASSSKEIEPESKEEVFVDLYKTHQMYNRINDKRFLQILENDSKTANMVNITKYLMYMATGTDYGVKEYDFSEYEETNFNSVTASGDISLTTTSLTKEQFIDALKAYSNKGASGCKAKFDANFLSRASDIYDYCADCGFNPELVITFALKESGYDDKGTNNFWGLETPNGSKSLKRYSSFKEGVYKLCDVWSTYMPGGSQASLINQRAAERQAANCNLNGYGSAGTLKGAISVYSDLCGSDTKHREGSSSSGGNYILKIIYGSEFNAKCGNVHKIGIDDYTIQEKADYTAWLYEKQLEYWTTIFGDYGTLTGITGNFVRYYQSNQSWSGNPYNYKKGGTIGSGGCGVCALAMAVTGLTGNKVTPDVIASFLNSKNIDTVNGQGAQCAKAVASKYGLTYELINRTDKAKIDNALEQGKCLIFSINYNGIYTGKGHFIMCYKKDGKGYYVLESARYYDDKKPYAFNQVFTSGQQGVFALGR